MLILGSRLKNLPVMGLQTGGELAITKQAIIDPHNLGIVAYRVEGPLLGGAETYLRIEDSRELSDIGFIIDSIDDFVQASDVIKLQQIIKLHFHLDGIKVTDENKRAIGKVVDYTLEAGGFTIQQLTVKRPLMKRFNDTELLIHRSQITEITDDTIIIHSEAEMPEHTVTTTPGSYVNPFRKGNPAAESVDVVQR